MDGRYIFAEYIPLVNRALSSPSSWQKFMDDFHIELAVLDYPLTFLIKDHAAGDPSGDRRMSIACHGKIGAWFIGMAIPAYGQTLLDSQGLARAT